MKYKIPKPKMICYGECEFCSDNKWCNGTAKGYQAIPLDY